MKIATDNVDADIWMIFPEKMQGMGQKVLGTLGFNDTKDNGTVFPVKKSGLPQMVIDQTPWYLRRSKMPIVKAKIGPKIMTLVADASIYDLLPVKREVKVVVSGIYITAIKSARGGIEKPEPKKGFFKRLFKK